MKIIASLAFSLACGAALIAPSHAADPTGRTDPVDPACSERTAPPEKCVIDDGMAPRPRVGAVPPPPPGAPPPAVTPSAPVTGASQRAPGPAPGGQSGAVQGSRQAR